jgi:hypothetical protein
MVWSCPIPDKRWVKDHPVSCSGFKSMPLAAERRVRARQKDDQCRIRLPGGLVISMLARDSSRIHAARAAKHRDQPSARDLMSSQRAGSEQNTGSRLLEFMATYFTKSRVTE